MSWTAGRLLFCGLVLNAVWEWVQWTYLYDMGRAAEWKGAVWMIVVVVAVGTIVLVVVGFAVPLTGKHDVTRLRVKN